MNIYIVNYKESFAKDIAELFFNTIHKTCNKDYTKEQLNAWANPKIDYSSWEKRLRESTPYLILDTKKLIGFCEFNDDYIDCFYIHNEYQGIGKTLLNYVLELAKKSKVEKLRVDASITAKPFFENFGFIESKKNSVKKNNQILINYSLELKVNN